MVDAKDVKDQVEDEVVDWENEEADPHSGNYEPGKAPSQQEDEEVDWSKEPTSTDEGFEPTGPDHG